MDLATITRSIEEVGALSKAAGAKVDEQLAKIAEHTRSTDARVLDLEQKILTRGAGTVYTGGNGPDLGAQIAKDPSILAFADGATREARVQMNQGIRAITRAVLTNATTAGTPPNEFPAMQEPVPGGVRGFQPRRLAVLESLPVVSVGTAQSIVPRLTSFTDGAGIQVKEGDVKPSSDFIFELDTLTHRTIATTVKVSKQLLADNGLALQTFLTTVLLYLVSRKLEGLTVADILAGGTAFASTETKGGDMVAGAVVGQQSSGYSPSVLLLNPVDFLAIFAERSTTGEYVGGGWGAAAPGSLWGIHAIPTAALALHQGLLIDTATVAVLDRQQGTVEMAYSADDFTRNLISIVAELRASTAIYDAAGISILTLPGA